MKLHMFDDLKNSMIGIVGS